MTEFTKGDIFLLSSFTDTEIANEIVHKEQEFGDGTPELRRYTPDFLRVYVANREFLENQIDRDKEREV